MADAPLPTRLRRLPPYLFAELEKKRAYLRAQGRDVIDLSIGDPDLPASELTRESLVRHLREPGIDSYPTTKGDGEFRAAVCEWMQRRFGVRLSPDEVLLAIGSKEIIAHTPLALTEPGDVVLIPEPGYPPYRSGTVLALAEPWPLPLRESNGFLPDLDAVPEDVCRRARILFLNYPNNPTGAVAGHAFFRKVVEFARTHGITVVSDAAYSEIYFGEPPASFLSVPGAADVGIEVHSMTKTASMAGWRIAWAAGNPAVLERLRSLKAHCDSGQFLAIQRAAADTLRAGDELFRGIRETYARRRDAFVGALRKPGLQVRPPEATFYVWMRTPAGEPSLAFAERALEEAGVVVTPGAGFGRAGEGYFRVALTQPEDRLRAAAERLARLWR